MPPKTADEVAQEKREKPRPDLVPARAVMAAGRAFAFGAAKHGTPNGRGTYRDPVNHPEQAKVETHIASFERHYYAWKSGVVADADSGLAHLDCAMAQLAIIVDLVEDPPAGAGVQALGAIDALTAQRIAQGISKARKERGREYDR